MGYEGTGRSDAGSQFWVKISTAMIPNFKLSIIVQSVVGDLFIDHKLFIKTLNKNLLVRIF